ncbi:MAG: LuxR C-terminal-related transcriptional regulator [Coriobacteriales bacterium]|nr:LuxR C-terminal-related transcriptional regulator [Coriobacteriales bacterium]
MILSILCSLGTIVNLALSLLPGTIKTIAAVVLLAIGTTAPLARSWRLRGYDKQGDDFSYNSVSHDESPCTIDDTSQMKELAGDPLLAKRKVLDDIKKMLSVIGWPFLGFLLFALTMGMQRTYIIEFLPTENLTNLISIGILLPLCFIKTEKPLLSLIYHIYLPVGVGILLILFAIMFGFPEYGALQHLGTMGLYVFFGVIGLLALSSFTAAASSKEFSVPLIFGFAIAAFASLSLAGVVFKNIPFFSEKYDALLIVLSMLYFIALVLLPAIRASGMMLAPTEAMSAQGSGNLESRCIDVSQCYGLSPRESEILVFIGRGYNPAFVAKKLLLSDSTVRSYVNNIYRKLSVHSQAELLQLIDTKK